MYNMPKLYPIYCALDWYSTLHCHCLQGLIKDILTRIRTRPKTIPWTQKEMRSPCHQGFLWILILTCPLKNAWHVFKKVQVCFTYRCIFSRRTGSHIPCIYILKLLSWTHLVDVFWTVSLRHCCDVIYKSKWGGFLLSANISSLCGMNRILLNLIKFPTIYNK